MCQRVVVIVAAVPPLHPTESGRGGGGGSGGRDRRAEGGCGGCHGNWESVAARHHLLLCCAEWSTLIFKLHGHRQTNQNK